MKPGPKILDHETKIILVFCILYMKSSFPKLTKFKNLIFQEKQKKLSVFVNSDVFLELSDLYKNSGQDKVAK